METCIYVFSGTGTSLAVSQKITDQLNDAMWQIGGGKDCVLTWGGLTGG